MTKCTGLMPPKVVLLLPQDPLAARRGDVDGGSMGTLGVSSDEDEVAVVRAACPS